MTAAIRRRRETSQSLKKKTTVYTASDPQTTCKSRASNVHVSFKNTRETANAIRGMTLTRAYSYLRHVLSHTECIPFVRYKSGVGRTAQAKNIPFSHNALGRWPRKSVINIMKLLKNAEINANASGEFIVPMVASALSILTPVTYNSY